MIDRVWLLEFEAKNLSTDTVETFRYSTHPISPFKPSDPDRPNAYFDARITDPANLEQYLYARGKVSGSSQTNMGLIALSNADGGLDFLMDYGLDGRALRLMTGVPGGAFADYTTVLYGTMEAPNFVWSKRAASLQLRVRDKGKLIGALPMQASRYAGTNSGATGVEGTAGDIKGKAKPLCYGQCFNVPAVPVNTTSLIYAVHHGAIQAVDAVYDKGATLTFAANYTDLTALQGATVAAGSYATCLAEGFFRLGASPSGQITSDIQGDASGGGYVASVAAIAERILTTQGGLSASDLDSAAFVTLELANSATVGLWIDTDTTVGTALDSLFESVGGWWLTDSAGLVSCGRLESPAGDPLQTWTAAEITEIERISHDLPTYEVAVGYARNWTVQSGDGLAASVGADRQAYLAEQYRTATADDSATLDDHPLALMLERKTLLANEVDAESEAIRLLALFGESRQLLRVTVPLKNGGDASRPGQVHRIVLPRFGMAAGKDFLVTGIAPGAVRPHSITLELWG